MGRRRRIRRTPSSRRLPLREPATRVLGGHAQVKTGWTSRFATNVRDYQGYLIGKTIQYLNDPEIISLAGGLPSPDVFQRARLRSASDLACDRDVDRIMQYAFELAGASAPAVVRQPDRGSRV